jgi:hypothetical protein
MDPDLPGDIDDQTKISTPDARPATDGREPAELSPGQEVEIDPALIEMFMQQLRDEQRLFLGLVVGLVAGVTGATLWAGIAIATQYQFGIVAVGVGILIGLAVRFSGRGVDRIFGLVAALIAVLACATGNLVIVCDSVGRATIPPAPFWEVMKTLTPEGAAELMRSAVQIPDVFFFFVAVWEAYRFAFRRVSQLELDRMTGVSPDAGPPRPIG